MTEVSREEKQLVSDIVYRLFEALRKNEVYLYGINIEFSDLFFQNRTHTLDRSQELKDELICLYCNSSNFTDVESIISKYKDSNYIVVLSDYEKIGGYSLKHIGSQKRVLLLGKCFEPIKQEISSSFKILAIIHVYNESDVIRKTTEYLLTEGIDVYLVDNWSTDESYEIIQELAKKNKGRVFFERFPENGKMDYFDLYHQMERTEQISKNMDYSWFIHYDADEYRVSPWKELTLKEAIYLVDRLGFNVIENTVINFKVTDMSNDSIFMSDAWFEFGHKMTHFEQIKTWKKSNTIELKDTGGHIAKINNPNVFPLKILNRHYPFRSYEHAKKKIFADRKPRFGKEKNERGWHGQYDVIKEAEDIITDTSGLCKWEKETYEELYIPLFLGCGIDIEDVELNLEIEDIGINLESEIYIYGAGKIGRLLYKRLSDTYRVVHWVDKNYLKLSSKFGRIIESPSVVSNGKNTYVLIAVERESIAKEICNDLVKMGIDRKMIIWRKWSENKLSKRGIINGKRL